MNFSIVDRNWGVSAPRRAIVLLAMAVAAGASAQERQLPEVRRIQVEQGKDREVIIEETDPVFRDKTPKIQRGPSKPQQGRRVSRRPQGQVKAKLEVSYIVVATVYDDGMTKLNWRSTSAADKTQFEAWSAFDWSLMYGFQGLENSSHRFSFLLHVKTASAEENAEPRGGGIPKNGRGAPVGYRLLGQRGTLSADDGQEAEEFLKAAHRFIGTNSKRIHLTQKARIRAKEENRLREIADRGKMKPPVTIRFSRVYRQKENADQREGGVK